MNLKQIAEFIPQHSFAWWLKYFVLTVVIAILTQAIYKAVLGNEGLLD